jgi:hypothetical protein
MQHLQRTCRGLVGYFKQGSETTHTQTKQQQQQAEDYL